MKKTTLFLMILCTLFGLTACGKSAEEKAAEQQAQAQAADAKLWGLDKGMVHHKQRPYDSKNF